MADQKQNEAPARVPYKPSKKPITSYPLIDNDPHFKRVCRYARTSDYVYGGLLACVPPSLQVYWEIASPSQAGKGAFPPILRLNVALGMVGGFLFFYSRSIYRFYGVTENRREYEKDMREMVDRVKAGEPLYGHTELSDYMQGVSARNSRYTGSMLHLFPMFNFTNHAQHGVDTAKYYQQAERELEAEKLAKKVDWKEAAKN